jgi:hypothetical protein
MGDFAPFSWHAMSVSKVRSADAAVHSAWRNEFRRKLVGCHKLVLDENSLIVLRLWVNDRLGFLRIIFKSQLKFLIIKMKYLNLIVQILHFTIGKAGFAIQQSSFTCSGFVKPHRQYLLRFVLYEHFSIRQEQIYCSDFVNSAMRF